MNPLIKIHGGKFYLHQWIIDHFPRDYEQLTFVDCFVGGGSIILNKKLSVKEIINDIDKELINIYQTLITDHKEFKNQLETYKYSYETFEQALKNKDFPFDDHIDKAINEYIIHRMSRGGLGETFAWSNRERNHQPGDLNAWETSINNLYSIHDRIKNIIILNQHFRNILNMYNDNNIFIYCDPPYLDSTRTALNTYKHEMSNKEHIEFLQTVNKSKAKILISGYESLLYNYNLRDWNKYKKVVTNHSAQTAVKGKRVEILWSNY